MTQHSDDKKPKPLSMDALFHPDGSPVDLGAALEPDPGEPLTHDQVDFLLQRIIGMLLDKDGRVLRAKDKHAQTALDTATRIALIAENTMGRPIRVVTEKDIDSRSRFRSPGA